MFARILGGLFIAVCGGVVCYYSYQIVAMFGRNARAERNLGGTRNAIVLFGVFLVVLGFLVMFGVFSLSNPADQIPTGFGAESTLQ
ncbi:MAG: hypothetical protein DLD55_02100 [candidate division SR1 bacterium]|nr:MAG: hypothetical protein DLD55_02100 [candidate division SR1 bacterium]